MGKWRAVKNLKDVCWIKKGGILSSSGMVEGDYPVIAGGLKYSGKHKDYNRIENSITISSSGANAGVVLFHKTKIFASDCSTVEWKLKGSQHYLYYELLLRQNEIFSMQTGLAQPHIYPRDIETLKLIFPVDVREQEKIAEILSTIDTVIEKTKAIIEKYKRIKTGIIQDLLESKIDEKHIMRLGEFADVLGGKRLPKDKKLIAAQTDHPYIRVRDITANKVLELGDDFQYLDDETKKTISHYIVNTGDLIISIVGTIGVIAVIGNSLDKANLTENCAKIIRIKGCDVDFLYYYLSSNYGQNEIFKRTIGEVQAKLPLMNILDIPVPVISKSKQVAIVEKLSAIDNKIKTEQAYLKKLQRMKQGLMQDLLTHKVAVDALLQKEAIL